MGTSKNVTDQDNWVLNDDNMQGNDSLNWSFSEDEKGKIRYIIPIFKTKGEKQTQNYIVILPCIVV